jgi:hypothetical protein
MASPWPRATVNASGAGHLFAQTMGPVIHVATAVPATGQELDSRSDGCDSRRSGDILKTGGAELLKVIFHEHLFDPPSRQAAAI